MKKGKVGKKAHKKAQNFITGSNLSKKSQRNRERMLARQERESATVAIPKRKKVETQEPDYLRRRSQEHPQRDWSRVNSFFDF